MSALYFTITARDHVLADRMREAFATTFPEATITTVTDASLSAEWPYEIITIGYPDISHAITRSHGLAESVAAVWREGRANDGNQ